MEEERIGVVLAKAVELRLKISNCIHKATTPCKQKTQGGENAEEEGDKEDSFHVNGDKNPFQNPETEEDDEETERLLNIGDALESLENQLSSLQALQHQQHYEREVALSEIENSRRMLLDKLKEYKGEGLEVLREASEFAGETVKHDNDLLLPPYPSRPPHSLITDNGYVSHFASSQKSVHNGIINQDPLNEVQGNGSEPILKRKEQSGKGLVHLISAATKTVLTLVGVVSVLSLSGFGPNFGKRGIPFKVPCLFQHPGTEENREVIRCPPGKVLLMEDGEARCVVRERIAVPLESMVGKPDVNYGCG
ncbi:hypothetical protein HS088_TW02G00139 [Tripterygium wilfordii]|uniref:Plastid division protein PDV2 n=2 Tax=Tripterygium wilfordii TaxID=458696 RepID=A0A7J7DXX6_TRIWF|nr:hypothetical protein HS088_TW02G00139 [Tripterygium wilfordii]